MRLISVRLQQSSQEKVQCEERPGRVCDALELASGPEAEVIVVGAPAHSGQCGGAGWALA